MAATQLKSCRGKHGCSSSLSISKAYERHVVFFLQLKSCRDIAEVTSCWANIALCSRNCSSTHRSKTCKAHTREYPCLQQVAEAVHYFGKAGKSHQGVRLAKQHGMNADLLTLALQVLLLSSLACFHMGAPSFQHCKKNAMHSRQRSCACMKCWWF